jgi:hypothetical protein
MRILANVKVVNPLKPAGTSNNWVVEQGCH